ncbi:hypothetical protein E4U47_004734 [Claviceps purpurea]|nr:hypothetical protein E4U50_001724 [Claviceps purpurea]KAG6268307.1 hypothetical protein E4U47_004734 [Claviceps purpurea]KAG6290854.1 hypothetical protein E4U46_001520 [Claviceps purpurea]
MLGVRRARDKPTGDLAPEGLPPFYERQAYTHRTYRSCDESWLVPSSVFFVNALYYEHAVLQILEIRDNEVNPVENGTTW